MKIVQINSVCGAGSTGRICTGIAEIAKAAGHECIIAYGREAANKDFEEISYRITGDTGVKLHALSSRLFGRSGTYSKSSTKKFLSFLDGIKPDVLHLHNLHGYYINVPLLFDYIKSRSVRVIWTLHDCWAFTGHCPYFDAVGCDKWKDRCYSCPQKHAYPKSFTDSSESMYRLKKEMFCGVNDMTLVTPSHWLASLVGQSFLKDYPVKVINNGIDLNLFCPTPDDFKMRYGISDKYLLLGVASKWEPRKGLKVFEELARCLGDDFAIALVGVDEETKKTLPKNIIALGKTKSEKELAKIYTAADLFVNPTLEENFPTVNIEALACGTPVITFDTGGSAEIIDESCGMKVPRNDVKALMQGIESMCKSQIYEKDACLKRASMFDKKRKFEEYIQLYTSV